MTPLFFSIAIPAFNRAHTLPRAIDSVLGQSYRHFELTVYDDGSTDATPEVMERYRNENRVRYVRFEINRGAVMMDELGMHRALTADVWSRLGSDDWWERRKLEADAEALRDPAVRAVYGPTAVVDGNVRTDHPDPHDVDPRVLLLFQRTFACSWANIAVRTPVLAHVLEVHSNICEPAMLRHVSDVVANARIVRFADFHFRTGPESAGIWVQGGATRTQPGTVTMETDIAWGIVAQETEQWGPHAA